MSETRAPAGERNLKKFWVLSWGAWDLTILRFSFTDWKNGIFRAQCSTAFLRNFTPYSSNNNRNCYVPSNLSFKLTRRCHVLIESVNSGIPNERCLGKFCFNVSLQLHTTLRITWFLVFSEPSSLTSIFSSTPNDDVTGFGWISISFFFYIIGCKTWKNFKLSPNI